MIISNNCLRLVPNLNKTFLIFLKQSSNIKYLNLINYTYFNFSKILLHRYIMSFNFEYDLTILIEDNYYNYLSCFK